MDAMTEEISTERNVENEVSLENKKAILINSQIENTCVTLLEKRKAYMEYALEKERTNNWSQYISCDGLPDPCNISDLNKFMFLWSTKEDEISMDGLGQNCDVVVHLLKNLDNIIDNSLTILKSQIDDYKMLREQLRKKLQCAIDMASYYLLRHIEKNMIRVDLKNARHTMISKDLICCTWAMVRLPLSLKHVIEKVRKPVEVYFDEVDLSVKMPTDVDCYGMAIRILRLHYDCYSDQGTSFQIPNVPQRYSTDEGQFTDELKDILSIKCKKSEINLRKFSILGGIYHMDLIYQPSQSKNTKGNIYITTMQIPKQIKRVPFSKPYEAPPAAPESERTPEVIEAEMKALEAAMEKLALVTLKYSFWIYF